LTKDVGGDQLCGTLHNYTVFETKLCSMLCDTVPWPDNGVVY